jgi:hypothetical protein
MPPIILRPDNFQDPQGLHSRIVRASSGQELVQQVERAYSLDPYKHRIEIQIYTLPQGMTNRCLLDLTEPLSETFPLTAYISIRPIRAPPVTD